MPVAMSAFGGYGSGRAAQLRAIFWILRKRGIRPGHGRLKQAYMADAPSNVRGFEDLQSSHSRRRPQVMAAYPIASHAATAKLSRW